MQEADPIEPVEPIDPIDPIEPIEPIDPIEPMLVFREPGTADEIDAAHILLGGDRAQGDGTNRLYLLVDIESTGAPTALAAVEVSAASRSWRVLRAAGETHHHPRLAAELVRVATGAGASSLTIAPGAPPAAAQMLATLHLNMTKVDGWVTVDL